MRPLARFDHEDASRAWDAWGCNCGPAAVAAVCNLSLDEVRPHLHDFESKRYTNPTLMWAILNSVGQRWQLIKGRQPHWPRWGLARVQWHGPWMAAGVPIAARYRQTHWIGVASHASERVVFDVNAICVGGWIPYAEWAWQLVPFILEEAVPRADGGWSLTHTAEVMP